jgi:hypothetical protein
MNRIFLKVSVRILPTLGMFVLIVRVLAGMQPPHPTLVGFADGCGETSRPCWYGILPGTPMDNAQQKLLSMGYQLQSDTPRFFNQPGAHYLSGDSPSGCDVELYSGLFTPGDVPRVDGLHLSNCRDIYAGDIVSWVGRPNAYVFTTWGDGHIWLGFLQEHTLARSFSVNVPHEYELDTSIGEVWVFPGSSGGVYRWHGFVPFWRYCQLESDYPVCPRQ